MDNTIIIENGEEPTEGNSNQTKVVSEEGEPVKNKEESLAEIDSESDRPEPDTTDDNQKAEEQPEDLTSEEKIDLNAVYEKLCDLSISLNKEIDNESHLQKMVDKLYDDKKHYEEIIEEKIQNQIYLDIIHVIEEIRAQISKFPNESTDENYAKLLKRLQGVPLRLEDLLSDYDVEPYSAPDEYLNTKLQKISNELELTSDETLANKIVERKSVGYKKEDKIIKKEVVKVYKYISENGGN